MNTLNEIRALRIMAEISKEIENNHNDLITLMQAAGNNEIQACKARREYRRIITAAQINCTRIYNVADKYFNKSGRVPEEIEKIKIYRIYNFDYIIRFFEL